MERMSESSDITTPLIPRLVTRSPSNIDQTSTPQHESINLSTKPIIVVVMLERLTYYSILANLFLFFKDSVYQDESKTSSVNSSKSVLILSGMSWLMCVAGGWISDAKLGKLKTLILGLIIYVIGACLLFVSAYILCRNEKLIKSSSYRALLVYASIIVGLVGEGFYKANISPFGAEQLSKQDANSTRRFFNYYYCSLNVGALIAFSGVAYFQQRKGFEYGFAIPFASICLALIVFLVGRKRYKCLPSQRIVGKVYQIMKEARKKHRRKTRNSPSLVQQNISWLDYAKLKQGGSYLDWEVEEVRLLLRVVPVFLVLIPYWSIYSQMQATFLDQGIHMNLHSTRSFSVPAAWLNLVNIIVIVILIPIMERGVYPWLTRHGCSPSPLTRITVGILIACLSIVAAGFVEIFVIQDMRSGRILLQEVNRNRTMAAQLSVFCQIPQYMLVGLSEVFAVVGGLEFAYRNAPKSMQSLVMALYFATHSLGSLLGSGLLEMCEAIDLIRYEKDGYYDKTYYFFLLCVLMLLAWSAFVIYIKHCGHNATNNRRTRLLRSRFFGGTPINTATDRNDPAYT